MIGRAEFGLRLNTELSYVSDPRYAPCLPTSRLGVAVSELKRAQMNTSDPFSGLTGVHVHCNCDSRDLRQLASTADWLVHNAAFLLRRCTWVNLGGGYLFDEPQEVDAFIDSAQALHSTYGAAVFLEPGAALVQSAGRLECTILDITTAGGVRTAILDASVNHLPNVFSYQEPPFISNSSSKGQFRYALAGPTCLAGDIFGTYGFERRLQIGERLSIPNVGAYTFAKSHMFNGVALPSVYLEHSDRGLERIRRYEFSDFKSIYAAASPAGHAASL